MTVPTPRNHLLAALPAADLAHLAPALEPVPLVVGDVMFDVHRPIEHAWFVERGVVSIVGVMADGTAIETATIGPEGMVGMPIFHETDRASAQAFCQVAGSALRLPADALRDGLARSAALRRLLHRYAQAMLTLVAQSSACNRVHTMRERCARWLLHTHDRVGAADGVHEFALTHRFLSQMLGVRRATVTEALGLLQRSGAIAYAMGTVAVRDRARLEADACECYAVIRHEFDRLLGGPRADGAGHPLDGVTTSEDGRTMLGDGAAEDGTVAAAD
jgi:CRP-like cAMP-binding protein